MLKKNLMYILQYDVRTALLNGYVGLCKARCWIAVFSSIFLETSKKQVNKETIRCFLFTALCYYYNSYAWQGISIIAFYCQLPLTFWNNYSFSWNFSYLFLISEVDCFVKFIKLLLAVFLKYLSMKKCCVLLVIVFFLYILSSSGQGFYVQYILLQ